MAKTATPIFAQTPNVGAMNCIVSTAMTNTKAMDGTEAVGTALALAFTAGAEGARIDSIRVRPTATNGSTATGTTAASVIRFWINNGAANTTATNNKYLGEVAIPATAVTAAATTANADVALSLPDGLNLPASYRIYAGATVAAGGVLAFLADVKGGDY
jgi:hypothetical protein